LGGERLLLGGEPLRQTFAVSAARLHFAGSNAGVLQLALAALQVKGDGGVRRSPAGFVHGRRLGRRAARAIAKANGRKRELQRMGFSWSSRLCELVDVQLVELCRLSAGTSAGSIAPPAPAERTRVIATNLSAKSPASLSEDFSVRTGSPDRSCANCPMSSVSPGGSSSGRIAPALLDPGEMGVHVHPRHLGRAEDPARKTSSRW
jgi:hypothetical protein